jgi:alpha-D-ribose 1-methylphosphonate 5-triphosphate diphosphatase PhnM
MATVMGRSERRGRRFAFRNPSARDLAEAGEIGILSSDYVPAALLMAPFWLTDTPAVGRG